MNTVYLNSITAKNLKYPINYVNQILEILSIVDSKIDKKHIVKLSLYYESRESYDYIYDIVEKWKPSSLDIEYIGNYSNYNPLIKFMISIIAIETVPKSMSQSSVNYII